MKRKIVLHGYLKDICPGEIELAGNTLRELVNGLCSQTKIGSRRPTIQAVGFDTAESVLAPLPTGLKEVHLVPAMFGGKGLFKIVLGALLIAVALTLPPGLREITITKGITIAVGSMLFISGAVLIIGGLLEVISPAPKDQDSSKYLGASGNTVKIGTRIPLIYGEIKIYGHYISYNVDTQETAADPRNDHSGWSIYVDPNQFGLE